MLLVLGACVSKEASPPGEEVTPAAGEAAPPEEGAVGAGVPAEEEAVGAGVPAEEEVAAPPSPETVTVDVQLEVDSTNPEGVKFVAPGSGSYEITIVRGATSHLPETDPSWAKYGGWRTWIILYINKPVEWGGPLLGDPQWGIESINFDDALGVDEYYPTIEEVEAAGQDSSVTINLDKDDYIIALEHDHLDYYSDNSGTITIRIVGYYEEEETPPEEIEMEITSAAFQDGETIPTRYTCSGQDISPALNWSGVPEGTQSFVLIVDDPDAPGGTFNHWVIFNIPADTIELGEAIPTSSELSSGALQGRNSFGRIGYDGPCPPPGTPHHYHFVLYALDRTLDLSAGASKAQVLNVMQGQILAQVELIGIYQR